MNDSPFILTVPSLLGNGLSWNKPEKPRWRTRPRGGRKRFGHSRAWPCLPLSEKIPDGGSSAPPERSLPRPGMTLPPPDAASIRDPVATRGKPAFFPTVLHRSIPGGAAEGARRSARTPWTEILPSSRPPEVSPRVPGPTPISSAPSFAAVEARPGRVTDPLRSLLHICSGAATPRRSSPTRRVHWTPRTSASRAASISGASPSTRQLV